MSAERDDRNAGRLLIAGTLGVLTAGCHGHGGGGGGSHDQHHGPPLYGEIEPNDTPYTPDFIGTVHEGTHLIVEGHVQAHGGWDDYDHFEFVAAEPSGFDFSVYGFAPGADLDVMVWDPDADAVVAWWDGPWNPEEGSFVVEEAGKTFVIAIEAYLVDSSYSFELVGFPWPHHGPEAGDPGAGIGSPASEARTGMARPGITLPEGAPEVFKEKHLPDGPPAGEREVLFRALNVLRPDA